MHQNYLETDFNEVHNIAESTPTIESCVFITKATATYSLGRGLDTLTAVP